LKEKVVRLGTLRNLLKAWHPAHSEEGKSKKKKKKKKKGQGRFYGTTILFKSSRAYTQVVRGPHLASIS
jgi:hypothetical protein